MPKSNLAQRIITSIFGIAIISYSIYYGFIPFLILVMLASLFSLGEFYAMCENIGFRPHKKLGILLSAILILIFFISNMSLSLTPSYEIILSLFIFCSVFIFFFLSLFSRDINLSLSNISSTVLGVLYLPFMLGHLILLRDEQNGMKLTYILFISIWAVDIVAYFVGRSIGRIKISNISPNKTLEGGVAGLIAGVGATYFLGKFLIHDIKPIYFIYLGIMIGIVSQIGDFCESMLKRASNVKDSSQIIPGHGGVLDRIDSFVFAAPMVYYFMKIFF